MFLYNLTLQKSTAIVCTAYGNFSAPKMHEIVVSHGKVLEMYRPYVSAAFPHPFPLQNLALSALAIPPHAPPPSTVREDLLWCQLAHHAQPI